MTTDDGTLKNPCRPRRPASPFRGPLRPPLRARCLRSGLRRRPPGPPLPPARARGDLGARAPGTPGGDRQRGGQRRRCGHPGPGPTRVLRRPWSPSTCPSRVGYATGLAFLSRDPQAAESARNAVEKLADDQGLTVLGWRDLPVDDSSLGSVSNAARPAMHQIFVAAKPGVRIDGPDRALALDRLAFVLRKRAEHQVEACYFASLSARTITYKGMLTSHQLAQFFPDLSDERLVSGLALVHSRFSTNTFPSWPLAHPYRYLAHNGEINTLAGNRNWMRAREALLRTDLIPDLVARLSDRDARCERLRVVRRGPRAAPSRRPPHPSRGADDDPRGVGEPPHDGPGPPRLLPVSTRP